MTRRRTRATWVSRKNIDLFCLDFSGFQTDPDGLAAEIAASEAVIGRQAPQSLLLAIDLHQTSLAPNLVAYLQALSRRSPNPLRRVAIIGLSRWRRLWYTAVKHIVWPPGAAFFAEWETAKAWLIGERDFRPAARHPRPD